MGYYLLTEMWPSKHVSKIRKIILCSVWIWWCTFSSSNHCLRCCIVDGYYCCVVDRYCFSLFCKIVVCNVCKSQAYFIVLSPGLSVTYYLFTLSCLSKQTRHGRNTVSFSFFLFMPGRSKVFIVWAMCGIECKSRRLVLRLQKFLERWPAALYEAGLSV